MRFYSFGQKISLFLFGLNTAFLIAFVLSDYAYDGTFDQINFGGILLTGLFGMGCLFYALQANPQRYTA